MWAPAPEFFRPWGRRPTCPKEGAEGRGAALWSPSTGRGGSAAQTLQSMLNPHGGCVNSS